MTERQFNYTANDRNVLGPVSADWLWERVNSGELTSEIQVCEVGTEHWLQFTMLPDSVFSVRVLALSSRQTNNLAEAEQLQLQAQQRLIECQSYIEVYGSRTAEIEQAARNGLEFIDAALQLVPNNPKYLNTKALLLADGLGQKQAGMTLLQLAATTAPNDIQIQQNIRALTNRSEGCLVVLGFGGALFFATGYTLYHLCVA